MDSAENTELKNNRLNVVKSLNMFLKISREEKQRSILLLNPMIVIVIKSRILSNKYIKNVKKM
jgi:hypothetical protein